MSVVRIAVVGHTNTGKTSLLRTLTRDVGFGEVSDRPAVTRHVEGTALLVDGRPVLELYDTPGLEDSIGLLEYLEAQANGAGRRPDWITVIHAFLESSAASGRFAQEAKALRQVLKSDVALYVIDVRDRVLGKYRDELEILSRCARPVVPVLNFTASDEARTPEWRDHLARLNLHAVAEFDTVVFDEEGERRLFEKMQSLLDEHREAFRLIIEDRQRQRKRLLVAAARLLADLLLDVAAFVLIVPAEDRAAEQRAMESMKQCVRQREQRCVRELLSLFRFRPDDGRLADLPMDGGRWGSDLFGPEAMKQFGVRAGSAAAAGAVAGLAIDAMVGGMTLGAATAAGAAIGALLETSRSYGRRMVDRARGIRELRCDDQTLRLLLVRQVVLIQSLLQRGHAAMEPVRIGATGELPASEAVGGREAAAVLGRRSKPMHIGKTLPSELRHARLKPQWSGILPPEGPRGTHVRDDTSLTEATGAAGGAEPPTAESRSLSLHDLAREAAEAGLARYITELLKAEGDHVAVR